MEVSTPSPPQRTVLTRPAKGGSFGTVYRALDKTTGEYVAIKHIDLEGSDDDIREIQQEISLLATCSSRYVTAYRSSFVRGTKLWIVMEYLGGGSCLDLLKPGPMEERWIAIIMKELLHGLDYLHSTGKIHRDIKAANILLSESGRVKIADFGVAAQLTNIKSQRLTFVGTPFWMAPEVIQEAGYDFHADIWSLGITAMEMALGEPPRSDVHPMKVLFLIPKDPAPKLEGNRWSKDFKDFVSQCLNKDADRRPSAKVLLKHSFIRRAGRTETLQDLVLRTQLYERSGGTRERDIRYYEETLRDMSTADEEDEWVFDTIRPVAGAKAPSVSQLSKTTKRRKLERIPSGDASDVEDATHAMEAMNLDATPLGDITDAQNRTPTKAMSTIKTPKARSDARGASVISARKDSISSPAARRASSNASGTVATARKVSAQVASPREPLSLDMSFGNGTSTVRQFRRVSSGHQMDSVASSSSSPQNSAFDSDGENRPPATQATQAVVAATKEAILGRRAYAKCLDPAFQEAYASCGDRSQREALSHAAEAWSKLDELDPEGELLLLKSIMQRVQSDPKLASALLPQRVANAQLASLRTSSTSPTKPKSGLQISEFELGSRDSTPSSSPSKPHKGSRMSDVSSPSKRGNGNASPGKLVLNPQNPHLRKMRSNQRLASEKEKTGSGTLDEKMPGRVEPGMEHAAMLSDALYARWTEGLKTRWPLS